VKGVAPTNHFSSQKTRLNDPLHGIKIWADLSSVLSQSTRLTDIGTDGQTDGQTDRILIARPHLHSIQRGKNYWLTDWVTDWYLNNYSLKHWPWDDTLSFPCYSLFLWTGLCVDCLCFSFGLSFGLYSILNITVLAGLFHPKIWLVGQYCIAVSRPIISPHIVCFFVIFFLFSSSLCFCA